ncbi:MAG TPA: hypothetical protein DEV81_21230 [Cyanobacteria bacterium UBA11049]|nr:hypothetical protein [Cyanobacteria bacterium UBA11049]
MQKFSAICFLTGITFLLGGKSVQAQDESKLHNREPQTDEIGTVFSPNAFKVPYLGVDGAFTIDTKEISATDPRNPKRIVFEKMEFFSFYQDLEGNTALAEKCRYVYKGAAGDPFYYPKQSKTSIWDLFELASGDEACKNFSYVILRSPHGDPVHMHMRYGNAESSFRQLLDMSDAPEVKDNINPWWSVYCAAGESGCDY